MRVDGIGRPAVGHDVIVPELAFMIRVGVVEDAYAAIHSATAVSAALNRRLDRTGTLDAGYDVDAQIHAEEHATSAVALHAIWCLLEKYGVDERAPPTRA